MFGDAGLHFPGGLFQSLTPTCGRRHADVMDDETRFLKKIGTIVQHYRLRCGLTQAERSSSGMLSEHHQPRRARACVRVAQHARTRRRLSKRRCSPARGVVRISGGAKSFAGTLVGGGSEHYFLS